MIAEQYARLTEAQKQCLRLVFERYEIKEIAQRLDLHESSVNERLKRARAILGVNRSFHAARLVVEHERALGTWIPPTGSSNTIAAETDVTDEDDAFVGDGIFDDRLEDSVSPFRRDGAGASIRRPSIKWPFPTRGRQENDLAIIGRTLWVPACAVIALFVMALIAVLTVGVQEVLGEIFSHGPRHR
jgi:DNA-binding CsgD family transcriptional regulator